MKTIKERAERYGIESANLLCSEEWSEEQRQKQAKTFAKVYSNIATEQRDVDKELIDMLIQELQVSRAYHLGITALDSPAEIAEKERRHNTALIRGIDTTIQYVKEIMGE